MPNVVIVKKIIKLYACNSFWEKKPNPKLQNSDLFLFAYELKICNGVNYQWTALK